jgi:hypothetical protein
MRNLIGRKVVVSDGPDGIRHGVVIDVGHPHYPSTWLVKWDWTSFPFDEYIPQGVGFASDVHVVLS